MSYSFIASRRSILKAAAAGAAVAGLGWHPTFAAPDREKELLEPATKEGEVTWYTSQSDDATAQALARDFEGHYPGIKVNAVRATAQEAFQRVTEEIKAGAVEVDVLSTTDIGHCVHLKDQGVLEKYIPANSYDMIEAYKGLDRDGYYHATSAGMVNIGYATNRLKEDQVPQTWPELLDPKWKDKITVGHPGFSGYVGTWVLMMRKLYGWDYFERLAQNNPQIGQSIGDTVTTLSAGKRVIGATANAALLSAAAKGTPLAAVYPTDGAVLVIAPSGIMKSAKHPNAAKLLMEYLLSVDASQRWVEHFYESIRPEVDPLPGSKSAKGVKVINPTVDEITSGIPEVIKQWRDTFGA
ncbi:MAG TPA: extracellular solute-binding protein [Alphaproteobacteria bacterium]